MTPAPALTRILASLGTLPFLACAVLPVAGISELPVLGETASIAALYGLTIASFMAGVLWGTALNVDTRLPVNLFITSNVVAVAAWLSLLLMNTGLTLGILAVLFAYLLFIDYRLYGAGLIGRGYWHTRLGITAIVISALLLTIFTY